MFIKPVSQLSYEDINDLVNVRQEREGYYIDYKGEMSNPDRGKNELAKDISAFANSSGGYLIMGVDKDNVISGVNKTIQNRPIDEWINQVLSSNIDPQVFYEDPKVVTIPDSDKVVVIIHVPESSKKPHMVTGWNTYHIRINDSCKTANHSQVRDMFEFSRNRTDEFNQFLQKRNLLDEDNKEFGIHQNSKELFSSSVFSSQVPQPMVLYSLIPKFPNEEKVKVPFNQFKEWLYGNAHGYAPASSHYLFYPNAEYDLKLDGVVFKRVKSGQITSYFEILNNGFIEAGLSSSVAFSPTEAKTFTANFGGGIYITHVLMYEMLLLGFARRFYEYVKYFDEVLLQISFINMFNLRPYGLHDKYGSTLEWRTTANKQHNNFKLTHKFNVRSLTDGDILSIAKHHAEKVCRAFGLDMDYCFVDDKLSMRHMNDFYL